MILTRDRVLRVINTPFFHSKNLIGYYVIGSIVSFFIDGFRPIMIAQLVLTTIVLFVLERLHKQLKSNVGFDSKTAVLKSDISFITFNLFIFCYYIIYNGYLLFSEFSWLSLGLAAFTIFTIRTLMIKALSINVLISNLSGFQDADKLEIPDGTWESLLNKWKLNDSP